MNNILLIFFAFPVAVIIISVILEKIFNCPVAVASLIFAIFLVLTFAFFDIIFLVATIAYTILAFITAVITRWIIYIKQRCRMNNNCLEGNAQNLQGQICIRTNEGTQVVSNCNNQNNCRNRNCVSWTCNCRRCQ